MPDQTSATFDYTMGYSEEFLNLLGRRSMETHAKHLLSPLKSGLFKEKMACLTTQWREHQAEAQRLNAAVALVNCQWAWR